MFKKLGLIASALLLSTACQSMPQSTHVEHNTLTNGLNIVDENHAVVDFAKERYILDTYIIPFEQPYYILIRKENAKKIDKDIAEKIAIDYILPRGCTDPLQRRADLDKHNVSQTEMLIGVAC
ncbi:hypothetical protein [Acinetobacter sp. c1-l78]|uniref:hypothetical protein n=1 Tax=Acinetobacter sp. c1-l78 TaxID=3342803 RepID=UPI0035B9E379